ncbi:MAG: LTA synthase family protein [Gammaproteobacteria bacterium]|nr:MAG: LTA synthase family protein [Gammaproteobacteria bacterium]
MNPVTQSTPAFSAAWHHLFLAILAAIAIGAVAQSGFRLAFLIHYLPEGAEAPATRDLAEGLWMGLRYDLKIHAIYFGLWLLALTPLLTPARLRTRIPRLVPFLALPFWVAANLADLVNHEYFRFYGSPINPLVFGFLEDDTRAVIHSIWSDFPVLPLFVVLLIVTWLQWRAMRHLLARIERSRPRLPTPALALYMALGILLVLFLARGSLGTFPINLMATRVTPSDFVNRAIGNGLFHFYYAARQRERTRIDPKRIDAGLQRHGFRTPAQAARALGIEATDEDGIERALYARSPENPHLEQHPPHVVMVQMESMGRDLVQLHQPGNDMLGRLYRHFQEDYLFLDFTSCQNGTHPTLECLLFNSPITPLTQGQYGFIPLHSSPVRAYHEAGYHTVFLTAGSASWRNLAEVLPHQWFDEVLDVADIRAAFPEAEPITWGVHDEYMFRYAQRLLEQADARNQPLMLFMMSVSYHPPFSVPADYRPRGIDLQAVRDAGLPVSADEDTIRQMLVSFQYAADALGGFLDWLKASPLGDHTLLAATGDHQRSFFLFPDATRRDLLMDVPFYLYLPPAYRLPEDRFDPRQTGSHRDIFPTLIRHSLSNAEYFRSGRNLLATPGSEWPALYRFRDLQFGDGLLLDIDHPRWYPRNAELGGFHAAAEVPPRIRDAAGRARAYSALSDWHLRRQVLKRSVFTRPPEPQAAQSVTDNTNHGL